MASAPHVGTPANVLLEYATNIAVSTEPQRRIPNAFTSSYLSVHPAPLVPSAPQTNAGEDDACMTAQHRCRNAFPNCRSVLGAEEARSVSQTNAGEDVVCTTARSRCKNAFQNFQNVRPAHPAHSALRTSVGAGAVFTTTRSQF